MRICPARDDKWCVTVRTFCFQWCSAYGHREPMGTWEVFIKDHHEGYISWAEYERNQALLASNAYRFPPLRRMAGPSSSWGIILDFCPLRAAADGCRNLT